MACQFHSLGGLDFLNGGSGVKEQVFSKPEGCCLASRDLTPGRRTTAMVLCWSKHPQAHGVLKGEGRYPIS